MAHDDDDRVLKQHRQLKSIDVERPRLGEIGDEEDQAFEVFGLQQWPNVGEIGNQQVAL